MALFWIINILPIKYFLPLASLFQLHSHSLLTEVVGHHAVIYIHLFKIKALPREAGEEKWVVLCFGECQSPDQHKEKELIVALMYLETLVGQGVRQGDNSEQRT